MQSAITAEFRKQEIRRTSGTLNSVRSFSSSKN